MSDYVICDRCGCEFDLDEEGVHTEEDDFLCDDCFDEAMEEEGLLPLAA